MPLGGSATAIAPTSCDPLFRAYYLSGWFTNRRKFYPPVQSHQEALPRRLCQNHWTSPSWFQATICETANSIIWGKIQFPIARTSSPQCLEMDGIARLRSGLLFARRDGAKSNSIDSRVRCERFRCGCEQVCDEFAFQCSERMPSLSGMGFRSRRDIQDTRWRQSTWPCDSLSLTMMKQRRLRHLHSGGNRMISKQCVWLSFSSSAEVSSRHKVSRDENNYKD